MILREYRNSTNNIYVFIILQVYDRLQKQGLCLGYEGSLYVLGAIGGKFNETLIDLIKAERRFRIVGDNINWHEGVHDQRKDHTSHLVHAFGSAILVQSSRIPLTSTRNAILQKLLFRNSSRPLTITSCTDRTIPF